ncbi:MAG: NAD(P)H-hydrate dehydratase [Candidatus Cloacimonetes bacterium]|nr:NAD(P)H-hydrate dehydratase [Candidatus Cloacimonadota bacterium]
MYVLSRQEMQALDRATIEDFGLPGAILMEHAGSACAAWIDTEMLSNPGRVAIVCGTGNNGGDGYVIARWLHSWGHHPVVFEVGDATRMSVETSANRELCVRLELDMVPVDETACPDLAAFDLVVDALFGIGLKGELNDWRCMVIEAMNDSGAPVAAVDIPSGVDADTGGACTAVAAEVTLTMAAPKYGHFLGRGRVLCGDLVVIDIGVPPQLVAQHEPGGWLLTEPLLPLRDPHGHKGYFGRIGVLAGSPGYSGAAIMASRGALRAGGGLVTLFHPSGMEAVFCGAQPELMTFALADDDAFLAKLATMDTVLAGCGMGTGEAATHWLELVIEHHVGDLALDADALTILSQREDLLVKLAGRPVALTPHVGEFARLTGMTPADILADPLPHLRDFAAKYQVGVLLKGVTSVFCDGDRFLFSITGNDGLATGGSGDVLAGIITAFMAQGLAPSAAAIGGAHLLGSTAERLAQQRDTASILPTDILDNLMLQ